MANAGPASAIVGQALVAFTVQGVFPEEPLSTRRVSTQDFGPALEALSAARAKLHVGSGPFCRRSVYSSESSARSN